MVGFHNRFHGRNSLSDLFKTGRTVRTTACSLRFVASKRRYSRVAVVVSKKVSKSAVKRNRIRRRLFSIIYPQLASFDRSYDLLFSVFSEELATIPASELKDLVTKLLSDAQIR